MMMIIIKNDDDFSIDVKMLKETKKKWIIIRSEWMNDEKYEE